MLRSALREIYDRRTQKQSYGHFLTGERFIKV